MKPMAQEDTSLPRRAGWGPGLTRWSLGLTVASLVVAATGLTLARYDVIAKLAGFAAFLGGAVLALLVLILGLAALVAGRKAVSPGRAKTLGSAVVSLLYVGFLATRPLAAGDAPAIHDVTTDLSDPPRFEALPLRADNLAGVGTVENWRRVHAQAYGDLRPITVAGPVPAVTARAVRLAEAAGWAITRSDFARGHIEATASVSYIRFYDDIVIRIAPIQDGESSRIDMRSVSRVGDGDLGVNARRIREFLRTLAAS
jgi:hypothetical protein